MSSESGNAEGSLILSNKTKYLTTLAVFLECITFGCAFNFFSPVLVDLKNKYETDVDSISKVFIVLSISYLIGSLAGGILYQKYIKRQHGVIAAFVGISLTLFATPYCPTIIHLFVCVSFLGFCCGAYDTAQTVWIMEMWQSKSGPYIQCQHFCFALGTSLPSFLTAPFLSDHDSSSLNYNSSTANDINPYTDIQNGHYESNMQIPFTIAASFAMGNVLYEAFLISCYPYSAPERESEKVLNKEISDGESENNDDFGEEIAQKESQQSQSKSHKIKLIALSGLFLGFYQGMEMCSIQFIPTLSQYGDLKLSETDGALVLTGLTGAFALGRALGILISFKVPSAIMLCCNFVLVTVGNVILMFWANSSKQLLWAGCITLGFGFSTMYASFCAFMERHLIFTDFVGCIMLVFGSVVGILYPLIVGRYLEENPKVLTFTNFFSIVACIGAFAVTYYITTIKKRSKAEKDKCNNNNPRISNVISE